MDIKEILSKVDHTILAPDATWEQVKQVCDDASITPRRFVFRRDLSNRQKSTSATK